MAACTEWMTQVQEYAQVQQLHYFIPTEHLGGLWDRIKSTLSEANRPTSRAAEF
jgi:hypothetical protein